MQAITLSFSQTSREWYIRVTDDSGSGLVIVSLDDASTSLEALQYAMEKYAGNFENPKADEQAAKALRGLEI